MYDSADAERVSPCGHRAATGDEHPDPPGVAAVLTGRPSTCKAAREAIAVGGEVLVRNKRVPQWLVAGIASTRLRRPSKRGLTTLGLDGTVGIPTHHRGEQSRTGIVDAADRSWSFTPYFDATGTEVLARGGVERAVSNARCRGTSLGIPVTGIVVSSSPDEPAVRSSAVPDAWRDPSRWRGTTGSFRSRGTATRRGTDGG